MFKGLGNLTGMLQQAREMQERMAGVKDRISELKVEGSAGGDMVRVKATGDLRITAISIEPSLLQNADREVLEDLVTAAVNQALQKAKDAAQKEMAEITGGMNIPGLQEAMSKFGLGGS